jgi:hypothetical protein
VLTTIESKYVFCSCFCVTKGEREGGGGCSVQVCDAETQKRKRKKVDATLKEVNLFLSFLPLIRYAHRYISVYAA